MAEETGNGIMQTRKKQTCHPARSRLEAESGKAKRTADVATQHFLKLP